MVLFVVFGCGSRSDRDKGIGFYRIPSVIKNKSSIEEELKQRGKKSADTSVKSRRHDTDENKDRPARTPHVAFVVPSHYRLIFYIFIFFLPQTCLKVLKEIFPCCKRWARADCVSDSNVPWIFVLNFLTAGWYVVTKGSKRRDLSAFVYVQGPIVKRQSWPLTETLLWCFLGTLLLWGVVWISNGPLQMFFSKMKPYFTPGGWHEVEGLGRLVMGFDVPDGIFCESFPFEHCAIEKSDLVVGYFGMATGSTPTT